MDDFPRLLEESYGYLTKEEELMTGKKMPRMIKDVIINTFDQDRQICSDCVEYPKSYHFRACNKPLSSLNRTTISELLVNVPTEGNYLLLRTLEIPVKSQKSILFGSSVLVPVEDHLGEVSTCCLYGYVLYEQNRSMYDVLPIFTVFALKEPCLKYCSAQNYALVVGSPSDFIVIDRTHALASDIERLGWRNTVASEENLVGYSKIGLVLKAKGNELFGQGKYEKAIETYHLALAFANDSEKKLVIRLKLSASYLKLELFESVIEQTNTVLEMKPQSEEALFLSGRAHYELRQYATAKHFFEQLLLEYPSNSDAIRELNRCLARLEESTGNIDIYKLYSLNRQDPTTLLDVGSYVGPIQLPCNTDNDHGVFAKKDIKPGTLILVDKSVSLTSVPLSIMSIPNISNFVQNLIATIFKNPQTFGKQILSLSTGNPEIDRNETIFCDEENKLEPFVDVYRLYKIIFKNALNLIKTKGMLSLSLWQIFPKVSKFNHSCIANSTLQTYNDVILVRSGTLIRKGEKVTISFWPHEMTYSSREAHLEMLTSRCTCLLCETDANEPESIHSLRHDYRSDFDALLRFYDFVAFSDILLPVKQMESTYCERPSLRIHLFRMYFLVAQVALKKAFEGWERLFMIFIKKGLKEAGLSLELLLLTAENDDVNFPIDTLVWEDLLNYASLMVEKEFVCGFPDQVSRWVRVLLFLERIFTGGNSQMLRDRFRNERVMSRILTQFAQETF